MKAIKKEVMEDKVKCCNCDWEGFEDDLVLVEFDIEDETETPTAVENSGVVHRRAPEPKQVDFLKGCPNCETDAYLANR